MHPRSVRRYFFNDEDGDIARCGGRARRRVMRSGQHIRVASTIDALILRSDAASVTCMDGSFDVILSTMVAVVSEGAVVQGLRLK